jgi:hypothetical protein
MRPLRMLCVAATAARPRRRAACAPARGAGEATRLQALHVRRGGSTPACGTPKPPHAHGRPLPPPAAPRPRRARRRAPAPPQRPSWKVPCCPQPAWPASRPRACGREGRGDSTSPPADAVAKPHGWPCCRAHCPLHMGSYLLVRAGRTGATAVREERPTCGAREIVSVCRVIDEACITRSLTAMPAPARCTPESCIGARGRLSGDFCPTGISINRACKTQSAGEETGVNDGDGFGSGRGTPRLPFPTRPRP